MGVGVGAASISIWYGRDGEIGVVGSVTGWMGRAGFGSSGLGGSGRTVSNAGGCCGGVRSTITRIERAARTAAPSNSAAALREVARVANLTAMLQPPLIFN
jgi:hypothetical protein